MATVATLSWFTSHASPDLKSRRIDIFFSNYNIKMIGGVVIAILGLSPAPLLESLYTSPSDLVSSQDRKFARAYERKTIMYSNTTRMSVSVIGKGCSMCPVFMYMHAGIFVALDRFDIPQGFMHLALAADMDIYSVHYPVEMDKNMDFVREELDKALNVIQQETTMPIILSGASAGVTYALDMAHRHTNIFHGLILESGIVCSRNYESTPFCRMMAETEYSRSPLPNLCFKDFVPDIPVLHLSVENDHLIGKENEENPFFKNPKLTTCRADCALHSYSLAIGFGCWSDAVSWLERNFDVKVSIKVDLSSLLYEVRQSASCLFSLLSNILPVEIVCKQYCIDAIQDPYARKLPGCTDAILETV